MCETMNSDPIEEELPIDRSDLDWETQRVFQLYDILQARYDSFSGTYLGKDLNILPTLFNEFEMCRGSRKYALFIIPIIDNIISEDIARKVKSKKSIERMPNG